MRFHAENLFPNALKSSLSLLNICEVGSTWLTVPLGSAQHDLLFLWEVGSTWFITSMSIQWGWFNMLYYFHDFAALWLCHFCERSVQHEHRRCWWYWWCYIILLFKHQTAPVTIHSALSCAFWKLSDYQNQRHVGHRWDIWCPAAGAQTSSLPLDRRNCHPRHLLLLLNCVATWMPSRIASSSDCACLSDPSCSLYKWTGSTSNDSVLGRQWCFWHLRATVHRQHTTGRH